jgi:hypothetical protein
MASPYPVLPYSPSSTMLIQAPGNTPMPGPGGLTEQGSTPPGSGSPGDAAKAPPDSDCGPERCWGDDCGSHIADHCHEESNQPCFSQHHHGFFGEFLWLIPEDQNIVYASPTSGVQTVAVPEGRPGQLSPNFAPGFRAGGEIALTCYSSLEGSFTWYEVSTHNAIGVTPATVLRAELVLPQTVNTALAASASERIDFRFGDAVYSHLLWGDCCHYAINGFVGGRYAHLDQDLNVDYTILGTTSVATRINLDGGGPRVGVDARVVGKGGLLGYVTSSASFIASHFGASFTQVNTFAGVQGFTDIHEDRIVPILDLEAGIGWISPHGHVVATCGYQVAGWFNMLTTQDFINQVQAGSNFNTNAGSLRDVLTFDGLVGHIEFRY